MKNFHLYGALLSFFIATSLSASTIYITNPLNYPVAVRFDNNQKKVASGQTEQIALQQNTPHIVLVGPGITSQASLDAARKLQQAAPNKDIQLQITFMPKEHRLGIQAGYYTRTTSASPKTIQHYQVKPKPLMNKPTAAQSALEAAAYNEGYAMPKRA